MDSHSCNVRSHSIYISLYLFKLYSSLNLSNVKRWCNHFNCNNVEIFFKTKHQTLLMVWVFSCFNWNHISWYELIHISCKKWWWIKYFTWCIKWNWSSIYNIYILTPIVCCCEWIVICIWRKTIWCLLSSPIWNCWCWRIVGIFSLCGISNWLNIYLMSKQYVK